MPAPVFTSISDHRMARLIDGAQRRVAVAAPAIRSASANALITAAARLGSDSVAIVLDCDEEVFRLGYGDLESLKQLRESACGVRQSSGLRVGVLVCDSEAWIFAPTALYVQAEVQSDETPNAILLRAADVERIISRLMRPSRVAETSASAAVVSAAASEAIASLPIQVRLEIADALAGVPQSVREDLRAAEIEIGHEEILDAALERAQRALEEAPPIAFDVARQVRVFEPYIQYVDISLRGCAIQRRRVEVPKAIQGIASKADLDARLRTTFELIDNRSNISSQSLENELNEIRDNFTRALGKPWGRVILRSARKHFDERMEAFEKKLAAHKESIKQSVADHLAESRKQLVEYYLPLVEANPPDTLLGQITSPTPSQERIRAWLDKELGAVFPKAEHLITEMKLDVQFRDVTYETLNEEGFCEKLKQAYPHVDWEKPFNEFDAAKARDSQESDE